MMFLRWVFVALVLASFLPREGRAAEADLYCLTGTSSTGAPIFLPAGPTNPCPSTATLAVAPLTSTRLSSTIAVTNTFQSIQVATASRNGCTVQNNDTNSMWVFFGAIGSATKAGSVVLAAGQAVSCAVGGLGVLTDQISITGTATGVFFATVQ